MKDPYPVLLDGEWFYPVRRGFRLRCCDCDLIHRMDVKVEDGWIKMRFFRDKRATAQARRVKRRR